MQRKKDSCTNSLFKMQKNGKNRRKRKYTHVHESEFFVLFSSWLSVAFCTYFHRHQSHIIIIIIIANANAMCNISVACKRRLNERTFSHKMCTICIYLVEIKENNFWLNFITFYIVSNKIHSEKFCFYFYRNLIFEKFGLYNYSHLKTARKIFLYALKVSEV